MNEERQFSTTARLPGVSRRDFVKVVSGAAAAASAGALVSRPQPAAAAPTSKSAAETTIKQFYETLSDSQKKTICFPFDHQLRKKHSANWAITEPTLGSDFYTEEQRKLTDQILRDTTSEEGYDKFHRQMKHDRPAGFGAFHVAVFGEPGSGAFQWELTGRHLTLRADGNSVSNRAFGGPLVYGHGAGDPAKNVYHYQTQKANEVFASLDAEQAKQALLAKPPRENQVPLQGEKGSFSGISVGALSDDQAALVEQTIKVILAPYRSEDVDEALAVLKTGGGLKSLHMTFYEKGDLNSDHVWDIWRLEGPSFVWHFRGAPHVHAYVNIGVKPS